MVGLDKYSSHDDYLIVSLLAVVIFVVRRNILVCIVIWRVGGDGLIVHCLEVIYRF